MMKRLIAVMSAALMVTLAAGCAGRKDATKLASGYVEATNVRVSSKVAGRLAQVTAVEGARVEEGAVLATLATTDVDFALERARAERAQAASMLALLQAGALPEEIQQAEAQAAAALSERKAVEAELASARADEARFEQLLKNRAGSTKQRDDAVTRRELAEARLKAADDRVKAARSAAERVKTGARPQEVSGAKARVSAIDAQIASLEHDKTEAVIKAPSAGIVGSRLVEPGELVAVGTPIAIIIDLDRAWASVYIQEPQVPLVRIDQTATVITDAGDRIEGRVTFISPKAEFTPRNVQTPDERAKLVYRVKVSVDNSKGVLKPGMPVEVDLGFGAKQ
jgi:HlyD family secretion protein